jgi:hypothetical protein
VKSNQENSEIEQVKCPSLTDLRAVGFGENYSRALHYAVGEIGRQISSSVHVVSQSRKTSLRDTSGQENLSSSYDVNSTITVKVENLQDVHVIKELKRGGETAVVACMHRSDAIKPYWPNYEKYEKLLSRSIEEYKADEPYRKMNAVTDADSIYEKFFYYGSFVKGIDPSNTGFDLRNREYLEMQRDFSRFRAEYTIYLNANRESAVYASFVRQILDESEVKKGGDACHHGIVIDFNQGSPGCSDSGVGNVCSIPIKIDVRTCSGKGLYSTEVKLSAMVDRPDDKDEKELEGVILKKTPLQIPSELKNLLREWEL